MKIVCVGDCGVDHYLPSGRQLAGGITANFARHAAREFGEQDEIHVISAIGDEPLSAGLVRRGFKNTRIHCHIAELHGQTPVQYIRIEPGGEKNFLRYDEGVLAYYRIDEYAARLVQSADLLVTPVFSQIREMFDSLMSATVSGKVAVDFADFAQHPDFDHLESYLDRIDIAFFGLSSGDQKPVATLAALAQRWQKLFVVTLGAGGSMAFAGNRTFAQEAIPVEHTVDTTGAGDAFAAAFLASHMRGDDVASCLHRGAVLASRVIQQMGAFPA
ncbi:MAG: PfkB family carbohydrate kinase [Woeseiaceae bacterium]|nr:PfkB family carbohydrate kinase [Woeseiaceae bacterium]